MFLDIARGAGSANRDDALSQQRNQEYCAGYTLHLDICSFSHIPGEVRRMHSDNDSGDLTACLTGIAGLIHRANELARCSVQASQGGNTESAINFALEVEPLLDEASRMLSAAFAISKQAKKILGSPRSSRDSIGN
jgi:hypothetical protein